MTLGSAMPYGPAMTRLLGPLHAAFLVVNRLFCPVLEHGGGALLSNPLTGYLLVLRTRGRRTGLVRSAPLGYVVLDGAIYCSAGFGETTAWYRNVIADARVEVVLPGRTLAGNASPVDDPREWARAYRALIESMGIAGRILVGDLRGLDDSQLLAQHGGIRLIRIEPTRFVVGSLDSGGQGWLVPLGVSLAFAAALSRRLRKLSRSHRTIGT